MSDVKLLRWADQDYPERMRPLKDMPRELFYIGRMPSDKIPSVAIVGGRKCSAYGRSRAFELGRYLGERGIQVISGMAMGVDSYAHEGALAAGGQTFAVLGCGADICYPRSNKGIYKALCERGGVISEFPCGTPPLKGHFPRRNRIISALADVVVVIEAGLKSGSLITAGYALDQGKAVYAYPDRSDSLLSEGSNRLIADGAGLVYSPKVILTELGVTEEECLGGIKESVNDSGGKSVNGAQEASENGKPDVFENGSLKKIYSAIGYDPVSLEDISGITGESSLKVQEAVFELVMRRLITELPGHLYVRL